ncbi:MAG: HlyC/CorC family transporter [Magnetococcales bacterium]|nr:HlyC/CorC family transporter [Magnetococcales bacterium]
MDLMLFGQLIAILLLVVGNAFFVGSEVAITGARRSRIKQMADMGDERAKIVKLLHDEPTRFYAVTQIGITLVSMALGYIGMDTFKVLLSPGLETLYGFFLAPEVAASWSSVTGLVLGFVIISFLHVVGGELAPKVLAYHKAIQLSCGLGWIINWLYKMWIPVIWVMNHSSNWLLIICGQGDIVGEGDGHGHDSSAMSAEELSMVINASASSGVIDKHQGRMLQGVFDIDEESIQSVMTPLPEVDTLNIQMVFREALHHFANTNHHRYPVMEGDRVVGVVQVKTVMQALDSSCDNMGPLLKRPISDFMLTDPYVIPSTVMMGAALREFNINKRKLGFVVNEHGVMLGIVTPDNILDRLEGEYMDMSIVESEHFRCLGGSQWEINGSMRTSDLELSLDFPFPRGPGYVTIGGLVFDQLGRMPEVGDVLDIENGRIQVLEIEDMRVSRVLFQIRKVDEAGNWTLVDEDSSPQERRKPDSSS